MSLCKERAWKTLEELSFVRVAGTPEELKAAEYLKSECEKVGVEAVIEEFEIDMPEIKKASFAVLEPVYKEYNVIGIGKTGETPEEGIEAELVYIEDLAAANFNNVKGKICLLQGRMKPDVTEKLVKAGAVGTISIAGNFLDEKSLKEELRPRNTMKPGKLPGLVIHISDAEELVRSHPTKVKMVLTQDAEKKGTSHNVVATIEGTDLKDEVLVLSAHYDSVPYSKGAWDNATGSITILEMLHYFKENQPRRTVKFVWCGSEEIGLVGSRKYCEAHKDELENTIFNINFDMTGVTIGHEKCCVTASNDVVHQIEYQAKLDEYPVDVKLDIYSSDSSSFAAFKVPSCTFARLAPMGGATIHNHYDTMEHLDPDSFMITLNFATKYASLLVNTTCNLIPRKFEESITKKLEESKKMFGLAETKEEPKGETKEEAKAENKEEKKEEVKQ
ncbi:MAG: M20/M25/M40 family metallo-hydrolase [Erysipelotrichales bacterium]|nr:M20/M25/M40 family metallo-hydrolase [Erysipelotrichales bacterium]